jgi:S-DNA-T family DNA segregation ATPase FtsK/SpoIIIE
MAKANSRVENTYRARLSRGLREAALLASAALTIYLLMALISYRVEDPGWSGVVDAGVVYNLGGWVGALIADILLSLFGYVGFTLPWLLFYGGWVVFRSQQSEAPTALTVGVRAISLLLFLASACGLSHLYLNASADNLSQGNGGILGQVVAGGMVNALNIPGTSFLLATVVVLTLSIGLGFSWLVVMDYVGGVTLDGVDWLLEKFHNWRETRNQTRKVPVLKESPVLPVQIKKPPAPKQRKAPVLDPAEQLTLPMPAPEEELEVPAYRPESGDKLPPIDLLDPARSKGGQAYTEQELTEMSGQVEQILSSFGVEVKVVAVEPGPVITRFELDPAPGVKVSQITNLAKDIARALSAISVRVVEVIPGKSVIGLEIPNHQREIVSLREVVESTQYGASESVLTLALGKDIAGIPVVADLSKMPHLLVAGTTGSGKSVAINSMILSMLYKATADQLRLIMIDPKMLELSVYQGIPHLLAPVVTDMKEAANALRWSVAEMERRYRLMAALGVRNLAGFNRKVEEAISKGKPIRDPLATPQTPDIEPLIDPPMLEPMPAIVVIIDELADLMMVVGKKVEELIARIAQKARAAGIHLIVATQRPSVDVITGLIKANIPTRIAFQVASRVDSRTILDQMGAESLLGHGDMLFLPPGKGVPTRVHGAFVDDHEVHKAVAYLRQVGQPNYIQAVLSGAADEALPGLGPAEGGDADGESDPLYDQAVQIVLETRKASISYVQRRLRIGYNRAARLVEQMERAGLVGPLESNGAREVLMSAGGGAEE